MSKRLQVLFEDDELEEIRRVARARRMTVAEWVRQSLRQARAGESAGDVGAKRRALGRAMGHAFPTGDIEQMLGEIEHGYAGPGA